MSSRDLSPRAAGAFARRARIGLAALLLAASCERSPRKTTSPFLIDLLREGSAESEAKRDAVGAGIVPRHQRTTLGRETRNAVLAAPPSRLELTTTVPPGSSLEFALGLATVGTIHSDPAVSFRIRLKSSDREETVFDEHIRRRDEWIDRTVDLAPWSGSDVRLVFETASESPDAALVLPLWGNPMLSTAVASSPPSHLFLISIDCLRASHVGAYGYEKPTTPHIDELARDAVVFRDAVSTSSWTLPAHMSMLTGLTPSQHGVVSLTQRLPSNVPYLPERLRQHGYETLGIVTWWFVSQTYGFDRGFDFFRFKELADADEVIDDAIARIRAGAGRDQFFFLHLVDPHWEYDPPPELLERLGPRPKDVSRLLAMADDGTPPHGPDDVRDLIRLYDGEIAAVDRALGRLFGELEELGLYDSSMIVVTADHGEAFYEHGGWQHESLYEEVLRVPLIVKFPGNAGGVVQTPVSLVNLFPTFLEQANVELPSRGPASLRALSRGGTDDKQRVVVSEYYRSEEARGHGAGFPPGTTLLVALRRHGEKYIASLDGPSDGPGERSLLREELYDLERDPAEREDLSRARVQKVQDFRDRLRAYLRKTSESARARTTAPVILNDDTKRQLESLGYVAHPREKSP